MNLDGNIIPVSLPQKRIFPPTIKSVEKIEDRRQALEDYLRTLLSCRDDRWRKTDIWYDFLALPASRHQDESIGSWLDYYDESFKLSKEIRSHINSRDTSQQDVSSAMQFEIKAKKGLMSLNAQLMNLEKNLNNDQWIIEGERRRREDQLNALKSEKDILTQLVNTTKKDLLSNTKQEREKVTIQSSIRNNAVRPTNTKVGNGRAFGTAYLEQQKRIQESKETKGLDNQQLLEYQNKIMKEQDLHVEKFSQLLGKQKEIGLAIHDELESHIDILDDLDMQVDKTATKLGFASKKLSNIK